MGGCLMLLVWLIFRLSHSLSHTLSKLIRAINPMYLYIASRCKGFIPAAFDRYERYRRRFVESNRPNKDDLTALENTRAMRRVSLLFV